MLGLGNFSERIAAAFQILSNRDCFSACGCFYPWIDVVKKARFSAIKLYDTRHPSIIILSYHHDILSGGWMVGLRSWRIVWTISFLNRHLFSGFTTSFTRALLTYRWVVYSDAFFQERCLIHSFLSPRFVVFHTQLQEEDSTDLLRGLFWRSYLDERTV